jgi:hypothetical protein
MASVGSADQAAVPQWSPVYATGSTTTSMPELVGAGRDREHPVPTSRCQLGNRAFCERSCQPAS